MRTSDRITFVRIPESYYDPDKGGYIEGEPVETVKPCKLSALGIDRTQELFGSVDTRITIARLLHPYDNDFDHVYIDGKEYQVKRQSDYRKGVFYLEGDF